MTLPASILCSFRLWDLPRLFWRIVHFCCDEALAALICCSKRLYELCTHDTLWKEILLRFNLQSLLTVPVEKPLYRYFVDDIITTKVLSGRYEYASASTDSNVYPVQAVTLVVSSASLGWLRHTIGRFQMLTSYRNSVEILNGVVRFSPKRRCFIFCCSNFGSTIRSVLFVVMVAQANRRWANQSQQMFAAHQGGFRLVMTPMLLHEGPTKLSLLTETDVIAVSKPPPEGVVPMGVSPLARDIQRNTVFSCEA
jgi:hypothetical protein